MPGKIRKKIKPIDSKIQKLMEDVLGTSPRIPVKKEMGGKVKKMQFGGDPTGNTMSEADMKRVQELMGRTKAKETGNAISDADQAMLKALLAGAGGSGIGKGMPQRKKMGGKVQKMNMGGQVMDTTKSMPVGMMDGGKVKKMNMGGVVPGRGGKFKGVR
jgi:hypothetical protein